jgi:asparaginyl-tRNA synthetase
MNIKFLLLHPPINNKITVRGWVKNKRSSKKVNFITINDGSSVENLQIVLNTSDSSEDIIKKVHTGVSIEVEGILVASEGQGQSIELQATKLNVLGEASQDEYPLQAKKHSLEFLRTKAHLRFRTSTFGAVFRIRSIISQAIHKFFFERNFHYLHSPIITGIDAEGAGAMFNVTNLDPDALAKNTDTNKQKDFFDQKAYLTVSGQLAAEAAIFGLDKVYTFGPTFRAENSNTPRHLAEFWMVEPEMAFYDLSQTISLIEIFTKYIINFVLEHCSADLEFLNNNSNEGAAKDLIEKLEATATHKFEIIDYSEAIDILTYAAKNNLEKFTYNIKWGIDLATEHEKYLVDTHFKKPIFIKNYPADIKAFYMRLNDDKKTVAAVDLLFPQIGEIVGGSQREERLAYLKNVMRKKEMDYDKLDWYIDTRRFGTVTHSGFGLGLDRMVQFVTGMNNIRDVIPFPRTPGTLLF